MILQETVMILQETVLSANALKIDKNFLHQILERYPDWPVTISWKEETDGS